MLIAIGTRIKIKSNRIIFFYIVLFVISGYYLIEDIKYVNYEMGLYGIDNRLFVCYELLPCIIRVICFFFCMKEIIKESRETWKSFKLGDFGSE